MRIQSEGFRLPNMCLRQSGILLGVSDTVGGDCHDFHGPIGNVDSGTMSKCIFMAVNYQGLAITGCIVFRATCLGVCKGTHFCLVFICCFFVAIILFLPARRAAGCWQTWTASPRPPIARGRVRSQPETGDGEIRSGLGNRREMMKQIAPICLGFSVTCLGMSGLFGASHGLL